MSMMLGKNPVTSVSVVVPVYNEQANIEPLLDRIKDSLHPARINYEVIFIDDHSTDDTWNNLERLKQKHPLKIHKKNGQKGKAQSLMEGFDRAKYPNIAMIDGDLQYPPEAIPGMLKKVEQTDKDVIVANRKTALDSPIRRVVSKSYRYVFGKLMWKLDVDVQSGLKVFKREVLDHVNLNPKGWTFDLEFLLQARNNNYDVGSHDIVFDKRLHGTTKVNVIGTAYEIGRETLKLKFNPPDHLKQNGSRFPSR